MADMRSYLFLDLGFGNRVIPIFRFGFWWKGLFIGVPEGGMAIFRISK